MDMFSWCGRGLFSVIFACTTLSYDKLTRGECNCCNTTAVMETFYSIYRDDTSTYKFQVYSNKNRDH